MVNKLCRKLQVFLIENLAENDTLFPSYNKEKLANKSRHKLRTIASWLDRELEWKLTEEKLNLYRKRLDEVTIFIFNKLTPY